MKRARDSGSSARDSGRSHRKIKSSRSSNIKAKTDRGVILSEAEKKSRKEEKKAAKMLETFGYSNDNNPFGDSQLTKKFVWNKKNKRDKKLNKKEDSNAKKEKEKRRLQEIKIARSKRGEREKEREALELRKEEETRKRERTLYKDWFQREEKFHLEQSKQRSKIRTLQKTQKPIDKLALIPLLTEDYNKLAAESIDRVDKENFQMALDEKLQIDHPMFVLRSNSKPSSIQEIVLEINDRLLAEQSEISSAFWNLILEISRFFSQKESQNQLRKREKLNLEIKKEVDTLIGRKNIEELDTLIKDLKNPKKLGKGDLDVDYWDEILEEVKHRKNILSLEKMLSDLNVLRDKVLSRFQLFPAGNIYIDESFYLEKAKEDAAKSPRDLDQESKSNFDSKVDKIIKDEFIEKDEEIMPARDEVNLPKSIEGKLKKPRYFNKVKIGYLWSKYNQAHYDEDNPPPKTVKGYQFNIFYPDLKDSSIAPKFFLEAATDEEGDDFCVIRFKADSVYEDVAFKIVNREWEKDAFHGFRSVFDNGVLQLHFNFRKVVYRK